MAYDNGPDFEVICMDPDCGHHKDDHVHHGGCTKPHCWCEDGKFAEPRR